MQDSRPAATSGHADSTSPVTATSPRQRLAELRVAPGVTNVLTGDSVARPIKPDLLFPGGKSQNLSVSDLAIDDVNHWLANIPRNREARRVVIYIRVNTCKFPVATESMWRQLIRKLKHVFPEAAVLASSLVSPMGRLRKTVQVSNAALLAVCSREKVSVVDHTNTFTARSGATRKDLYRDQLHPSDSGTSRLWCLISSLVLAPAIALLNRNTSPAPALTRNKTFHSSSQDSKGSKTLPSSSQAFAVGTSAVWICPLPTAPLAGSVDLSRQ